MALQLLGPELTLWTITRHFLQDARLFMRTFFIEDLRIRLVRIPPEGRCVVV